MKCATCKNNLVIRTDPKNCDYEFVEGIRRKEQGYDLEVSGNVQHKAPMSECVPSNLFHEPCIAKA